jgi:hypothetical protein
MVMQDVVILSDAFNNDTIKDIFQKGKSRDTSLRHFWRISAK